MSQREKFGNIRHAYLTGGAFVEQMNRLSSTEKADLLTYLRSDRWGACNDPELALDLVIAYFVEEGKNNGE